MINRSFRQRKLGNYPDEVEALQTDVMRFLAIICMCLMIVFSLVQSIPVSSRKNKPELSNKTLIKDEVKALEEAAAELTGKITYQKSDNKIQKQVEKAPKKENKKISSSSRKKGFSLRFASNPILEHLLNPNQINPNQGVKLYLFAGGKYWVLKPGNSMKWKFVYSKPPKYLYDMDLITVPYGIKKAGKKVVAAFGKGQMKYGVTLSSDIRNELSSLMSKHEGGDLVILKNGKVALE